MLPPFPEPFLSFSSLATMLIPNGSRGVPGVTFARDARFAAIQAAANVPFLSPTPPFPYPYPPRCKTPTAALITPGSPAHTLASAYWAYGWCEGILAVLGEIDIGNPVNREAKHSFWAFRFPNRELETWDPRMGGFRPKAWDDVALRTALKSVYAPPRWENWFFEYARANFTPPTCFWPHAKPSTTPSESPRPH